MLVAVRQEAGTLRTLDFESKADMTIAVRNVRLWLQSGHFGFFLRLLAPDTVRDRALNEAADRTVYY